MQHRDSSLSGRRSGDSEFDVNWTTARKQQQEKRRQGLTAPTARGLKPMDLQELGERFEMHFGAFCDLQSTEGLRLWDRVTSNLDIIQEWTLERMVDVDIMRLGFGAQLLVEECEELRTVPLVAGWSGFETMRELVERLQTSLGLLEEVLWMWEVGIPTGMHHCSLMGALLGLDPHEYNAYLTGMRDRYVVDEEEEGDSDIRGEEIEAGREQDGDMAGQLGASAGETTGAGVVTTAGATPGPTTAGVAGTTTEGDVATSVGASAGETTGAGVVTTAGATPGPTTAGVAGTTTEGDVATSVGASAGETTGAGVVTTAGATPGPTTAGVAGTTMQEGDGEGRVQVGHKPHTRSRRVRGSRVGRRPPPFQCGKCGRGGYRPNNRQRAGVERMWEAGGRPPFFPPAGVG